MNSLFPRRNTLNIGGLEDDLFCRFFLSVFFDATMKFLV